jgi:hypothetical protein
MDVNGNLCIGGTVQASVTASAVISPFTPNGTIAAQSTVTAVSAPFTLPANGGAVLFFDEADALFGKRTEVSDAHDRYANIESAYLLARLERFDGVAILATNLRANLDRAFLRRFEVVLDFAEPGPAERAAIWRAQFPPAAPGLFSQRHPSSARLPRGAPKAGVVLARGNPAPHRVSQYGPSGHRPGRAGYGVQQPALCHKRPGRSRGMQTSGPCLPAGTGAGTWLHVKTAATRTQPDAPP